MRVLVLALVLGLPGLASADVWWINRGDSYQFVYSYPPRNANPYPQTLYPQQLVWDDDGSNPEPSEAEGRGDLWQDTFDE